MLPLQLLKIWLTVQMQFKVVTALSTLCKIKFTKQSTKKMQYQIVCFNFIERQTFSPLLTYTCQINYTYKSFFCWTSLCCLLYSFSQVSAAVKYSFLLYRRDPCMWTPKARHLYYDNSWWRKGKPWRNLLTGLD